jgi:CelD/BcsL family acetyltransferase involved in cellulose biosynthesis
VTLVVERAADPASWGPLIAGDPDATIFHEPEFLAAMLAVYPEFRPYHLYWTDTTGRLLGALPTVRVARTGMAQILSLPFGSYGTPLVAAAPGDTPARIRAALVDAWKGEATAAGVVRAHFVPYAPETGDPARGRLPEDWRRGERTHVIPLTEGFDAIWFGRYDKENRTAARKAVKAGVVVAEDPDGAEVLDALYRRQAREWTGHALYRYGLFRELLDRLGDRARVWVARQDTTPVFAVMAFYHKGVVTPWVSGAAPEARASAAGNLIHKVIIEDGCRRGYSSYNFGGSGGVAGIEAFKVAFGGEPVDYHSWFRESPWFGRIRLARRRVLRWLGRD